MKLYDYLENKYNEGDFVGYTLERFIEEWLYSNMANDSMYEGFLNGDFLGCHYRYFEIDHKNRIIDFEISDEEDSAESNKVNVAISVTKDMLMDILDNYKD